MWLTAGVASLVMVASLVGDSNTTALAYYAIPGWLVVLAVALIPKLAPVRTTVLLGGAVLAVAGGAMRGGFVAPNTLTASTFIVVLGSLLLTERGSWLLWLAIVIVWVGLGLGFTHGLLPPPPPEAFRHDGAIPWVRAIGAYAALSALCIVSVRYLVARMEGSTRESQRLLAELRAAAEARIQALEEQRLLERRLQEAERLEALGRLAGGVAHDFNNLLMVVLSNVSIIRRPRSSDTVRGDAMREIELAAARGADLTRQLLSVGRQSTLDDVAIDVAKAAAEALQLLRRLLPSSIELDDLVEPEVGFAFGPGTAVEQTLLNLTLNARDAMPGGGRIVVRVSRVPGPEDPKREFIRIRVRDSGSGMDEETQRHLFEPFFTTKEVGQGTGLGLSTVGGIAKRCGGEVRVDSSPGAGSTFDVYLPACAPPRETPQEPQAAPAAAHGTVLVVEDDPLVRKVQVRVLRGAGLEVLEASNGVQALEIMQREHAAVDLVVTDAVMPSMGGRELVDALIKRWPQLPIVVCSGYTPEAFDEHVFKGGRRRFLAKPYVPGQLIEAVQQLLSAG